MRWEAEAVAEMNGTDSEHRDREANAESGGIESPWRADGSAGDWPSGTAIDPVDTSPGYGVQALLLVCSD